MHHICDTAWTGNLHSNPHDPQHSPMRRGGGEQTQMSQHKVLQHLPLLMQD